MRTTSHNVDTDRPIRTPDDMIQNMDQNPADEYLAQAAILVAIAACLYGAGWVMIWLLRLVGFAG